MAASVENLETDDTCKDTDQAAEIRTIIEDEVKVRFQAMLGHIARSKVTVRSQQLGDEEISIPEKIQVLTDFFSRKPVIFLERYHRVLRVEDLQCFSHLSEIYEVDFYMKDVRKRSNVKTSDVQRKNRRYEALKKLESEGDYFSSEQMRSRAPLMYEHYIGQYLTDAERAKMKKEIDKSDLKLSTILLEFMDEADIKILQERQKEEEEMVEEEEESDDEENEDDSEMEQDSDEVLEDVPFAALGASTSQLSGSRSRAVKTIPDEEKELLSQEFRHLMQEKFLKGNDKDFDYSKVDDNVEYDSLDIRGRDEEDSYFDDEEPCEAFDGSDSGDEDGCKARTQGKDEEDEEMEERSVER